MLTVASPVLLLVHVLAVVRSYACPLFHVSLNFSWVVPPTAVAKGFAATEELIAP